MMLKKTIKLNRFFDYYGPLLTERQREVFQYYYHEDLSYQEIAEILSISRSGVYDTLKRTENFLIETEEKLGFVRKYDKLIKELSELNIKEVNEVLEEEYYE